MIQRVQTIWLLIVALCAFASLKFSVYSGNIPNETNSNPPVKLYQEVNGMCSMGVNISTIAIGLIALIAIFLFKNRKLQINLCLAAFILETLVLAQYYYEIKVYMEGNVALTSLLQPLILLGLTMAIRGIRKDEKIISESDRLR